MNKETITATISAASIVIVNVAALMGFSMSGDEVSQFLSAFVMIAATLWGIWKNHNFTRKAQAAQLYLAKLKEEE